MKAMFFAVIAGACAPCMAQSPITLMPEGSRESWVGAIFVNQPEREGSRERESALVPYFRVQWSNGLFVENLSAGLQMSRIPHLRYGPLVALGGDGPRGTGDRRGLKLLAGGFAGYRILHNLGVDAVAVHRLGGTQLKLAASTWAQLAPHHSASFQAGVNLADSNYMRWHFGETAAGGVKDTYAGANWHWQASRKYELHTRIKFSRLGATVAASPSVETRDGVHLTTALVYGF
jgi:outer membrane scaffolding protein for murein synthesis (MipA/OmpV family)